MNLLQAIVDKLAKHYPDINIYVNDMEQGVEEPCFFVKFIHCQIDKAFSRRYKVSVLCNVVYLNDNIATHELHAMTSTLSILLIDVGCYAEMADSDIKDHSISMSLTYHYFVEKKKEAEAFMQNHTLIQEKERKK